MKLFSANLEKQAKNYFEPLKCESSVSNGQLFMPPHPWPKILTALSWPKIFMALPLPKIFMAIIWAKMLFATIALNQIGVTNRKFLKTDTTKVKPRSALLALIYFFLKMSRNKKKLEERTFFSSLTKLKWFIK